VKSRASISPDVLARYAGDAALEVDGVRSLGGRHLSRQRPVRIVVAEDGSAAVELHLVAEWGASFGPVGSEVQARVAEYLARMAGVQPTRVDVSVDEVGPVRD